MNLLGRYDRQTHEAIEGIILGTIIAVLALRAIAIMFILIIMAEFIIACTDAAWGLNRTKSTA